jgi:predicted alpha-1,6-mannanase (GH76 family)
MKLISCAAPLRLRGLARLLLTALLLSGVTRVAHAQWSATDAQTAFSDYNNAFYFNPSGSNYDYRVQQGSTTTSGFWVGAEEIELAEDAYAQNPTSGNQTIITQLCNGFVTQFTGNWSGDTYDDDLMWATIAFVRAYNATGNSTWLSDAETNFATVWSRGYDTTNGGIWWNTATDTYKASASNWTFVIAGNLLYRATGNTTYQSEAKTIYTWAMNNLYNGSTGEVYDGVNVPGGVSTGQYTYNYGTAIGANYYEGDATDATNMATYLIKNFSSGTYEGYNLMPDPGNNSGDGSGFNGITLRWVGYAYVHDAIHNGEVLQWAQANVDYAWSQRNTQGLSWADWDEATPNGTNLYSWNCSDTVVGMLDIPTTGATLMPNGTYIITSVHSGLAIEDPDFSSKDGEDMDQYTVNHGTNQQWTVTNLGSNVITLTNGASGQLLDVDAASKSNGALVDQWPANNQTNQQWNVIPVGPGAYELTSVNSGLALDVDGGGTNNEELIDQYTYQGNPWQQWVFTSY